MSRAQNHEENIQQPKSWRSKIAHKLSLREKMKNVGVWENGHAFFGAFLLQKSKLVFAKFEIAAHTLSIPMQ